MRIENMTYIRFTRAHVHTPDDGWRIFVTPIWLWKRVSLLRVVCEQMSDRCRLLGHLERPREQIHLVVFLAHLVRYTASPRLDAVEDVSLLVVARLADVDLLVLGEASGAALVVSCMKHHEAAVHDVFHGVITVTGSLHDFVLVETLRDPVHRLLGAIVPTSVDPLLLCFVLPHAIDLGHNGLGQIVRVADVNPVA